MMKRIAFRMDAINDVCLEFKEKVVLAYPLEKVLTNQLEGWTAKKEEEVQKWLEDLNQRKKFPLS